MVSHTAKLQKSLESAFFLFIRKKKLGSRKCDNTRIVHNSTRTRCTIRRGKLEQISKYRVALSKKILSLEIDPRTIRLLWNKKGWRTSLPNAVLTSVSAIRSNWIFLKDWKILNFPENMWTNQFLFGKRFFGQKKFEIFGTKQRPKVWVQLGEELLERCCKQTRFRWYSAPLSINIHNTCN